MRTVVHPLSVPASFALSIALALGTCTHASAQLSIQTQPPRITQAIDESSLVTLRGNIHPLAQSRFDQGPAPASMPASRMLLVLTRSTQQEAELQTYLQSVQDAGSHNYRKFLTPDEFGARFGVGDADLQTIQGWLTAHGFTVKSVSRGRTVIEFSGTAAQIQGAFHTSLHSYLINGVRQWANSSEPQIPSALAPVISGVASLNGFRPKAHAIRGPSGFYDATRHTITPSYTIGDPTNGYYIFLGPADAATIYDTPTTLNATPAATTYSGAGVIIGIAGDSNIDVSQNANYRSTFSLAPNPVSVVVDGTDPGENGDAIEAYLDTEVSSGIAPDAKVILYTASDTQFQAGLFLAINRAIDDNQIDILNVSFGGCEAAQGTAGNQYIQNLWEQAAAQGISVTVSSGDSGSAGCDDPNVETQAKQGLAVNGLGSTPYNIAVGGTDFDALYSTFPASFTQYVDVSNSLPNHRSALSYIPEEPWNDSTNPNYNIAGNKPISVLSGSTAGDNIAAAGGGISQVYPVPSWQSGATGTGRNLPDVSFLAGNGFYGALWGLCTDLDVDSSGTPIADCTAGATGNSFNLTGAGGTSAAAPAFAGMLALLKQKTGARLGQADYALYNLAKTDYSTVFHDVTVGDNSVNCASGTSGCSQNISGYNFMTGYDAATGYDPASGLGSVDAAHMLTKWSDAKLDATTSSLKLSGGTVALNITHGQPVTVAAGVTSSGDTPTGNIAVVDSLSPASNPHAEGIAEFALSNGSASGTTNSLPGGTYTVSAHYGGSGTFAQSDSNAIPVTVAPESSSVSLKIAGVYDPSTGLPASTPYYGFIYLIDAQPYGNSASAAKPNGAATGTITFKNGTTTLGTAPIASNGVAELQTITLPGGNNSLTAAFPGDASFQASTSPVYSFAVTPAVTTLATPYDQTSPQNVLNLGIELSSNSAGVAPTGTVTFQSGSTSLGSATVYGTAATTTTPAAGSATLGTASMPPGTYSITGVYSGDSNYASSTSPAISVTLPKASTMVSLAAAANSILTDQPVQVTLTVSRLTGLPVPTGTATLTYGSVTTTPASLVNGAATFTIPANTLAAGFDELNGSYSGDADYASGTNDTYLTVNPSGTIAPTITVTAPTGTISTYPVLIKVAVTGPAGDPAPTGTLTISGPFGGLSMSLVNGLASFTFASNLPPGPNSFIVLYPGDSTYTSKGVSSSFTFIAPVAIGFSPFQTTINVDQSLTETITITGRPNFATATGTVTFSGGSYKSPAMPLSAGSVTVTIPANSFAVGIDSLTATYSGDSNYLAGSNTDSVTVNPAPIPGLSLTGTAVTLTPGAGTANTSTITVTPTNGFTGTVALTAAITNSPTGAQHLPSLSFGTTSPVSITGSSAGSATLTITTTAPGSAAVDGPTRAGMGWYESGAAIACLVLFGIPAGRRRWRNMLGMLAFLALLGTGMVSCGGGGGGSTTPPPPPNPGTTAGSYTITVTATAGAITTTGTVVLTVQ